ncbi:GNAT family N-acetyltransferase [Bacillus horti]|uniref:GNAT superfamily N-acetyltransferase n=1 Tax=Caldalkalibacillus horti TaxID=77523 RepID=A0ABT9W0K8_9BACI|nr:GNAT family N-acetyltransferase [Bacillus horti]MDQ0166577.1 GNAT superfamily N-acetyltransferase [Bacillus horti]
MSFHYNGIGTKNELVEGWEYDIKLLDPSFKQRAIEFENRIVEGLEKREYFVSLTEMEWEKVLGEQGITAGIFFNGELVGLHAVLFPHQSNENLGLDIGLDSGAMELVAHLESVCIHPKHRGKGLHYQLAIYLIEYLKKYTAYRYLLETVAPGNWSSLKSILKSGLVIVELKEKYNGLHRYICFKDIKTAELVEFSAIVECCPEDILKQEELLKAGYVGFQMVRNGNDSKILFGKTEE